MIILVSLFVKILGNKHTKTDFIHRILELGECLCVDTINVKRRLEETGLFLKIEVDTVGDTLVVRLKEYWYIWPSPVINYSFDKGLTLGISFLHGNFRGYGENLYLIFTLGAMRSWEFGWGSPNYRFMKRTYSFSLGNNEYESYVYRAKIRKAWKEISFSEKLEGSTKMEIQAGLYSYNLSDRFMGFRFVISKDTRDWINYPRKGYAVRGMLSENFGNFVLRRLDVQIEGYRTFGNLTLSTYLGYSRIFGQDRFYLMPNFIGTDDALRGNIPKEMIVTRERFVISVEPRILVFNSIPFLSRFLDGGLGISPLVDMGFMDGNFGYSLGLGFPVFLSVGDFLPAIVYNYKTGLGFYLGNVTRIK